MNKDYSKTHYDLYQFFAGYFPQGLGEIYIWEEKEPHYHAIVRKLKTEITKEQLDKTIAQLKDILIVGKGSDEEDWADILTWGGLGLNYYPPGSGQTYEEWLEDVLKILEEPMEETLKHFIPERI